MPEGPQMVFLKEQAEHLIGMQVVKAGGNAENFPFKQLHHQHLTEIKTYGKELLFCFSNATVRVHLMLFGKCAIDSTLNRKLRLGITLTGGEINFYAADVRYLTEPLKSLYNFSTDILHPSFNKSKALKKLAEERHQLICDALLDQHIFAGVGNKIKNEALWRQRVHPESCVGEIPKAVLKQLVNTCVQLGAEYLEWIRNGNDEWKIYRKQECPRDTMPVLKQKIGKAKRTCYFCDTCQRLFPDEVK